MSDHVALLDHGKVRFVGTPKEFEGSDDPLVRAFADRRAAAEAALRLIEAEPEPDDQDDEEAQRNGATA
jgi:ABC-type transporter Mla maintaining outer membrane lipid asymmetry ATPase subunit MlaF